MSSNEVRGRIPGVPIPQVVDQDEVFAVHPDGIRSDILHRNINLDEHRVLSDSAGRVRTIYPDGEVPCGKSPLSDKHDETCQGQGRCPLRYASQNLCHCDSLPLNRRDHFPYGRSTYPRPLHSRWYWPLDDQGSTLAPRIHTPQTRTDRGADGRRRAAGADHRYVRPTRP